MSRESDHYPGDDQEPRYDCADSFERFLLEEAEKMEMAALEKTHAPAMFAARQVLELASRKDRQNQEADSLRTQRFKVRSAGTTDYPFKHDRIILKPRNRRQNLISETGRIMRFAVSLGDHLNEKPEIVCITDFYGDDREPFDYILTSYGAGKGEGAVLDTDNKGYLTNLAYPTRDKEFDPELFVAMLENFELHEQSQKPATI